jgi:hypothetical protein
MRRRQTATKREPGAWGYSWGRRFTGAHKYRDLALQVGVERKVDDLATYKKSTVAKYTERKRGSNLVGFLRMASLKIVLPMMMMMMMIMMIMMIDEFQTPNQY